MQKIIIIGISEEQKYQLESVYDVLPTEELKQMFLNNQIDLYDMTSYPEKGDAIDAILIDMEDVAAVVAHHIYWQEDLSPIKIPYFYNDKNECLPVITKELGIPLIVMGDQPDGTFAYVKIYNT
jgi:hypothetical protein